MNSIGLVMLRALDHKDDFVRLLCFTVQSPVIHATEPELPRTGVGGSEFDVGAPTSEEEAERKKSRTKSAPNSPLTAVLESWLLSILHCRFSVILVAHSLFISR